MTVKPAPADAVQNIKSVDEIAVQLGISRRLLDLRFRQVLSKSVLQTIQESRLEKVCTLLKTTNLSINEICATSGLGTATRPYRLFKQHFGLTMSQYRQSYKKKGV